MQSWWHTDAVTGQSCVPFGCFHAISLSHIVQRHGHPHNWELQGVHRCECESEWQFASFPWTAGTHCSTTMTQSTDDWNWVGGKSVTVGSVTVCMAVSHINSLSGTGRVCRTARRMILSPLVTRLVEIHIHGNAHCQIWLPTWEFPAATLIYMDRKGWSLCS